MLRAPLDALPAAWSDWELVVPARSGVSIDDVDVFADHIVLYERREAQQRIAVLPLSRLPRGGDADPSAVLRATADTAKCAAPGAAALNIVPLDGLFPIADGARGGPFAIDPEANTRFNSERVRFEVSSPIDPPRTVEWSLSEERFTAVGEAAAVPQWDPSRYVCERLWAPANVDATSDSCERGADGAGLRVPITVARRKDVALDGSAPLLLCAYGAYGVSLEAFFDVVRLPLLARGWIVASAHPRGGGELGRAWHDDGRLARKGNTLADVAACARTLHGAGYGAPQRTAAMGRSAGALAVAGVA
mgnify:CR=1 FL=1